MVRLNWGMRACGILLLWAATAVALPAQTFTTLRDFHWRDGAHPTAGVVQGTNGDLYGTTYGGGANGDYGTVFKITPGGKLTTLYSFTGGTDGYYPQAGMVLAANGDFYGTTDYGGTGACSNYGCGTVFKITPSGSLTTLYNFCSQSSCTDGRTPRAALVQGTNGDLYGTTQYGGANNNCDGGCGTVFKITTSGTLTTLYSFCSQANCTDGYLPVAGLVQGTNGNFYGTTAGDGTKGNGTFFSITPSGILTTLYSFCSQTNCTDGAGPTGIVQGTDGSFYGTTMGGGASGGGTVFSITSSAVLTTIYSFCSQTNCADGAIPTGLIQATDGSFYGTTTGGGASGGGTVFSITASGTLTTLYIFCSQSDCKDGGYPVAGLVQDTNGNFYGTTQNGGASAPALCNRGEPIGGCGSVFSLSVGLGPLVETLPASGEVGEGREDSGDQSDRFDQRHL
jgi:uncharacterized repeat protein (TIGR03803 family)